MWVFPCFECPGIREIPQLNAVCSEGKGSAGFVLLDHSVCLTSASSLPLLLALEAPVGVLGSQWLSLVLASFYCKVL